MQKIMCGVLSILVIYVFYIILTFYYSSIRMFRSCFNDKAHITFFKNKPIFYIVYIIYHSFRNSIIFPVYWYKLYYDGNYEQFVYKFNKLESFLLCNTQGSILYEIINQIQESRFKESSTIYIECLGYDSEIMINLINQFFKTDHKLGLHWVLLCMCFVNDSLYLDIYDNYRDNNDKTLYNYSDNKKFDKHTRIFLKN